MNALTFFKETEVQSKDLRLYQSISALILFGRYPQFSQHRMSNKKQLSSGLTFYVKFIMPTIFLGLLLLMALFGFISGEPMGGIAGLFGTGIFGFIFYLLFMRLNSVKMDEQHFYISNFRRTEELPISDLIEVTPGHFINAQRIWLIFRTDEPLNKSFIFMPYFSFGAIFSTHPAVKKLSSIAKTNREKHSDIKL